MTIVYVGSMEKHCNAYGRYKTLGQMGHQLYPVDIDPAIMHTRLSGLHYRFNMGPGITKLGSLVLKAVETHQPEILWIDNKCFIPTRVLQKLRAKLPAIQVVNLITDDPTGRHKRGWRLTLKAAPLVNWHFVQREINIAELKAYGAQRVGLCYRSFDPDFHRKITLSAEDLAQYSCRVGFVGTYEEERAASIAFLIQQGFPVAVTGNDWPGGAYWDIIKPYYKGPSVYGDAYIKTLNGMEIALHFLRHGNRDEQDSRTFEIPACGTFMLAEDSAVHRSLFAADREAVFFQDNNSLLQKLTYYLDQPDERKAIAEAGFRRCHQSAYSHRGRLEDVLKQMGYA